MRIVHRDPNDRSEISAFKKLIAKIDRWWDAFSQKKDDLVAHFYGRKRWDLPDWMGKYFQAIHEEMMWEFGSAVNQKGHRLVMTPEVNYYLRPLAALILERAPKIEGWEFYLHRLPENVASALATVEARTQFEPKQVSAAVTFGEMNRIDVLVQAENFKGQDRDKDRNVAFVLLEALLGQDILEEWIGIISTRATPRERMKNDPEFMPLSSLKKTVDGSINKLQKELPGRPYWELTTAAELEWSLFKLNPESLEEYPGRRDMITAITCDLNLFRALHGNVPFFGKRFSKHDEKFIYLKIDRSEGLEKSRFNDRGEIEDALSGELTAKKIGGIIGSGTGLMYSYIDLAVTDLPLAIATIRQVLIEGKIPKRSWILFFDADMKSEWIGIYKDTPAPPLENE